MYFVPLSQIESVELVVHALRAAGGEADCSQCPAYKVCMKQCLAVATAVSTMLAEGNLPQIGGEPEPVPQGDPPETPQPPSGGAGKGRLKVIK